LIDIDVADAVLQASGFFFWFFVFGRLILSAILPLAMSAAIPWIENPAFPALFFFFFK
jgi:hypothetical protein